VPLPTRCLKIRTHRTSKTYITYIFTFSDPVTLKFGLLGPYTVQYKHIFDVSEKALSSGVWRSVHLNQTLTLKMEAASSTESL
jgi:hypothetical protein